MTVEVDTELLRFKARHSFDPVYLNLEKDCDELFVTRIIHLADEPDQDYLDSVGDGVIWQNVGRYVELMLEKKVPDFSFVTRASNAHFQTSLYHLAVASPSKSVLITKPLGNQSHVDSIKVMVTTRV